MLETMIKIIFSTGSCFLKGIKFMNKYPEMKKMKNNEKKLLRKDNESSSMLTNNNVNTENIKTIRNSLKNGLSVIFMIR